MQPLPGQHIRSDGNYAAVCPLTGSGFGAKSNTNSRNPLLCGGSWCAPTRPGPLQCYKRPMFAPRRLKIGLTACFQHADPSRSLFTGKTLQYVEQSIAHWIMSAGAMVVMVPCPTGETARWTMTTTRSEEHTSELQSQ